MSHKWSQKLEIFWQFFPVYETDIKLKIQCYILHFSTYFCYMHQRLVCAYVFYMCSHIVVLVTTPSCISEV
jgi:hypothetical protein